MPCTRNNPQQIPRRYNEKQRPIAKRQDKSKYVARESKKSQIRNKLRSLDGFQWNYVLQQIRETVVRPVQQHNIVNVK